MQVRLHLTVLPPQSALQCLLTFPQACCRVRSACDMPTSAIHRLRMLCTKHWSFSAACTGCRTHEHGEEQLAQILNEGITTFLCLQAGAHAATCISYSPLLSHMKPSFSHQ